MSAELEHLRRTDLWIAWVRLGAVVWALVEVAFLARGYPPGHEAAGWATTAVLAAGAVALMWLSRAELRLLARRALGFAALAFDTAVIYAYVYIYAFEAGTPTWSLVYLAVIEAAVRYGLRGGIALPLVTLPLLAAAEIWRAERFAPPALDVRHITLPLGIELIMGVIVGWLVKLLRRETASAEARAAEAEALRDQLGRRADQLEAVNRCARALASSLDLEDAFDRFLREVQTVFEFDRLALILVDGGRAEVMATAGRAEETLFPAGSWRPAKGSVLEVVHRTGRTVYREDMEGEPRYPEELELAAAGLRSRVTAPLALGPTSLGILSVSREQAGAFTRDEIDLITLLARQAATAVQNIRTYAAERSAAEELRRLSALRADFVSLVSHELRAPMASVIGCATTLRRRWRELGPDQRESFLALIEQETSRLATLIGDVLDTSRIEAGTFTYSFDDVDVAELVRETAALVAMGQDEVRVRASVGDRLPAVRADRDRLRQLLMNLLTNAIKYTHVGDEIEVTAVPEDGFVAVSVRDHGPGIPPEQQRVIFEKFGRANPGGKSTPGAGLGLFIARSIAEAHGGSLEVSSEVDSGSTFTFRVPLEGTL